MSLGFINSGEEQFYCHYVLASWQYCISSSQIHYLLEGPTYTRLRSSNPQSDRKSVCHRSDFVPVLSSCCNLVKEMVDMRDQYGNPIHQTGDFARGKLVVLAPAWPTPVWLLRGSYSCTGPEAHLFQRMMGREEAGRRGWRIRWRRRCRVCIRTVQTGSVSEPPILLRILLHQTSTHHQHHLNTGPPLRRGTHNRMTRKAWRRRSRKNFPAYTKKPCLLYSTYV